jgi:phage gp36-like protein
MPYCTESDILTEISEAELIGLTDDESTGAVIDAVVTAAIAKADALIDSYCGQVETVPFTTVPDIVQQHSVTIAIYFLYARRSAVPENRAQNYKDAIAHLKDIATGKASLPIAGEETGGDEIEASHTEEDRKFTMGKESDGSTGSLDNY